MDVSSYFQYEQAGAPVDELRFLGDATDEDWARLVGAGRRERFRAGDVVLAQGDTERSLFIVLEGTLETVLRTGRRQRRLSTTVAGAVLGELGFLDGAPRSASVVAQTDVEVLRIEFDDFVALSRTHPELTFRVMLDLARTLAMRVRRLTDTVADQR